MHKRLLTSQSEYFDKALNGGFKEAEESSIHLEEDDPAAIALLIGWLYRGVIPGPAAQSVNIEGAFPPSTIDKVVQPVGGTSVEVEIHTEQDGPNRGFGQTSDISCFQTILCHPRYKNYSSEELRLADYSEGRRYKEGSEDLADMGPDLSSSGMYSRRQFHVWPAPTPPTLYGSTPLVGGGIGGVARSAFGTFPPQGAGAGFGSNPLIGGGIGGVTLSAASNLPVSGGLFGNPPPAGSSLFGPSTVASSGGVFVNLGSQSQPPPFSLFGVSGSQNQPSSGGLFGGSGSQPQPASGGLFRDFRSLPQTASGSLFGGSGSHGQPSSGSPFGTLGQSQPSSSDTSGIQSASIPQGTPSVFPTNPIASPFGPSSSRGTLTQPAQSGSVFGNPLAGGGHSALPSGGLWSFGQTQSSASSGSQASGGIQPASSSSGFHYSPGGCIVGSSSNTTATTGGNGLTTSTSTVPVNPFQLAPPAPQTTTQTTPSVVSGNQASSSDSSNKTPVPAGSAAGLNPTSICLLGTAAQTSSSAVSQPSTDSGMSTLTTAVKSALNIREDANKILSSSSTPIALTRQPLHSEDSSGDSDNDTSTITQPPPAPNASNRYQAFPNGPPAQSAFRGGSQLLPQTTQNPPPPPFSFPIQTRPALFSTSPFSTSPFSQFNPPKFGTHTTSQNPFDTTFSTYTTQPHQLALLNLTLFAETTCWPILYNASITSYISGERTLTRPPPLDHITLIYERTHDESSLRRWAVDNLAAHKGDVDMSGYMGLLVDYEGFLEGVLKKLREKGQGEEVGPGWDGAGGLKYRMLEHGKKNPFGDGKGKGKGKASGNGGGSFDMQDF